MTNGETASGARSCASAAPGTAGRICGCRVVLPLLIGRIPAAMVRPPRPAVDPAAPAGAKPPAPPVITVPKSLYLSLLSGRDVLERLEVPVQVQVPSQYVVVRY